MMWRSLLIGIVVLSLFSVVPSLQAEGIIPANDGYVTDEVNLLSEDEEQKLETMLKEYNERTSNQIAVVILKSLQGEAIEDVALRIARAWEIGQEKKNNGILLLLAYEDRMMRIEVGYGLEGAVPDIVAKGVITTILTPAMRDGKYEEGIEKAIDALIKHIGGEYTADRYQKEDDIFNGWIPFLLFIVIQWLLAVLGRTKSWWLGGVFGGIGGIILSMLYAWFLAIPILIVLGLLLDYVVSANYHRRGGNSFFAGGSWGPGGGGGSSFGGFGGGGFGGGGASGKW